QRHRTRQVPLRLVRLQPGLAGRIPDRRDPDRLASAAHPRRPPRQSRAQNLALPDPARRRPADPRRPAAPPEDRHNLAVGASDRDRLGPDRRPASPTLTSRNHPNDQGRRPPGARGTPGTWPASRPAAVPRPQDQDQLRGPAPIPGQPPPTVNDQG